MKLEDLITELEQKHAEVVGRLGTNEFSRHIYDIMTKLRGIHAHKEEPKVVVHPAEPKVVHVPEPKVVHAKEEHKVQQPHRKPHRFEE